MNRFVLLSLLLALVALTGLSAQAELIGYWAFDSQDLVESSGYAQSAAGGSKAAGYYDGEVGAGSVGYTDHAGFGKALDLSGGDNAVWVKNSTALNSIFKFGDHTPADSTIAFWVQGWPGTTAVYGLVTRGVTRGGNHGLGVAVINSSSKASFKYGDKTISGIGGTLGDSEWHHVAAVVDAAALKVRLYVDGSLAAISAISATGNYYNRDVATDTRYIVFGADQLNANSPLSKFAQLPLDEIRIYNEALSQEEIRGLMDPIPEPGTLTLIGMALLGLGFYAWRRSRR